MRFYAKKYRTFSTDDETNIKNSLARFGPVSLKTTTNHVKEKC